MKVKPHIFQRAKELFLGGLYDAFKSGSESLLLLFLIYKIHAGDA